MQQKLNRNIVLIVEGLNIPLLTKEWFSDNDIIDLKDIDSEKTIFSSNYIQITERNKRLIIIITEDRIQIEFNPTGDSITKTASQIIEKITNIACIAIGVNLRYAIDSYDENKNDLAFGHFYNENSSFFKHFFEKKENQRLGGYLSKDHMNCRLRIDIKPNKISFNENKEDVKDVLIFNFNWNRELESVSDALKTIKELENNFLELFKYSQDLIRYFEK